MRRIGALQAKWFAALFVALALLVCRGSPLQAQSASQSTILAPGFAIVSGFSGAVSGGPLPPGVNPADKLTINLNGVSLRTIDVSRLNGPPNGQVVPARKVLAIPASQIGQVYAIALDDAVPPNIYAAATSVYGLPIVVPDADGDGLPDRTRRGTPDARFMPGLFGPAEAGGGPGSIWKIDGQTGAVSLFANVQLDGVPNTGAALGGLAYDPASQQLFVSDRGSGIIHRFNLDGIETGRFDHGTQALVAARLPPVVFDSARRTSVLSPQFDSTDPSTWGYAPEERRVFGLAVHRGRLYYAVAAGLSVWSVSLAPDGAFGADARLEIAVPPGAALTTEISKIIFDDGGDMLLAERGAPTGAYDFGALRAHDTGRVLRFRSKSPGAGGTPFYWEPVGDYAIGFPPNFQNGDGGIALGYGYDPDGYFNLGACGATLWSTGSQLRISPNPALAERLSAGGALPIDGLQGNAVSLMRPQNTPPLSSYFIDADDVTDRADTPGHMGDVATWRACPGISWLDPMIVETLVVELWCPPGFFRSRDACVPTPCRPGEFFHGGRCVPPRCPPELQTPIRGLCCPPGTKWNPKTRSCRPPEIRCPPEQQTPIPGLCCPAGTKWNPLTRSCTPPTLRCPPEQQTPIPGLCCPAGTQWDPKTRACRPPEVCPLDRQTRDGRCCPEGQTVNGDGSCKPPQRDCRVGESPRQNQCVCRPPAEVVDGRCTLRNGCLSDRFFDPARGCVCKSGREANGVCLPERVVDCTGGRQYDPALNRCVCPSGQQEVAGVCVPPPPPPPPPSSGGNGVCPAGTVAMGGRCCTPETIAAGLCGAPPPPLRPVCTGGKILIDNACRCGRGTVENARGVCVKPPSERSPPKKKKDPVCKKGFHREGGRCVPNVRRQPQPEPQQQSLPQLPPGLSIGIGIGVGGGGRPGGGRPGAPPPPLRPPAPRPN